MPKRGSQSVREQNYKWLAATWTERCILNPEHLPPPGGRLDIDEISYAPEHYDDPANLSLVCHSCNCFLRGQPEEVHRRIIVNARRKRRELMAQEEKGRSAAAIGDKGEEGRLARQLKKARRQTGIDTPLPDTEFKKGVLDYFNGSSEMKANAKFYPAFALVAWQTLMERGPVAEDDLLDIGALLTKANQTTLKRYLKGWCAPHKDAPLTRTDEGGRWMIYFKNPAQAKRAGGKRRCDDY